MGKRMFDGGERFWPEEAPFHTPVFVVTHERRAPWERPGGTTFHFVNDGIDSALAQARAVAGGRDIRIAGGADLVRQYLDAGLVDEFTLSIAPVILGQGTRLFDENAPRLEGLSAVDVEASPRATHLTYAAARS
jgi:dihydrofolate reductase